MSKTAFTRHAGKHSSEFLPLGKVKPDLVCWQGEVCFLSLLSELLIAVSPTATILALGQETPILGFPICLLSLAELCPVRLHASPAGALPSPLATGPQVFHLPPTPHGFSDLSVSSTASFSLSVSPALPEWKCPQKPDPSFRFLSFSKSKVPFLVSRL